MNFRLGKHLRDIVAHAGLSKEYEDEHGKKEILAQDSVFEKLSADTLEGLEAIISHFAAPDRGRHSGFSEFNAP